MDKLRQIIQDKSHQKDPFWISVYNSDIRNLFPKYQLAKIDRAKIKYDKFRLIMENIEDFIFIEKHRKETKRIVSQVGNIKEEIEELRREEDNVYHYQLDIIKQRDHVENICQQIIKYGNQCQNNIAHRNIMLDPVVKQNEKWNEYFTNYCKKPQQVSKDHLFIEKVELAKTIEIPNTYQALNQSTASQILLNRYKKQQINKKLMEKWLAPDQNGDVNIDKELAMDWKNKIKEIDFKLYV